MAIGSTGNVGIGTISPTEKLDVRGNLRVEGDIINTTLANVLDGYGSGGINYDDKFAAQNSFNNDVLESLDGYSTATDLAPGILDGYAKQQDFEDIVSSLDGYTSVTGGEFGDGYVLFFTGPNAVAGDNDLFWDRLNNRLGIGTETPEEKLDVAGTIVADSLKARDGAIDGYVLTSDENGLGTWKDPAIMFERLVVTEDGRLVLDGDGNPTYIDLEEP